MIRPVALALTLFTLWPPAALAAPDPGAHTVQARVTDATSAPRAATCELSGEDTRKQEHAGSDGLCVFRGLRPGAYLVRATALGFTPNSTTVVISKAAFVSVPITVRVPAAKTTITVSDTDSLLNSEPGNVERVSEQALARQSGSQMSRDLIELVRARAGWLLEANGVLHPRGSEYNTQYVIDGLPVFENRSPGFAPPVELLELQSVAVQTGGYPASIGRKLGGVVELHTRSELAPGLHGSVVAEGGGFNSRRVAGQLGFARSQTAVQASAAVAASERFMDPPSLENFANHGFSDSVQGSVTHRFDERRKLRFSFEHARSNFDVPNEPLQEAVGQRQDRWVQQRRLAFAYQHLASERLVVDLRASALAGSARLESNLVSTPIAPNENRNHREFYLSGAVSGHHSHHDFATGADLLVTSLHERFRYQITDISAFVEVVLPSFAFDKSSVGFETSAYIQDRISIGPLIANIGLRWDSYDFLVRESAWSPRAAAAWTIRRLGLVVHGSYDRVFGTPAAENLLLASSSLTRLVSPTVLGLPVRPETGHFLEVGATKRLFGRAALNARAYRRALKNFSDDDVFLNTGIAFPITFAEANVQGFEANLRIPLAQRFSAALTYSNLSGTAQLPVTGGLLLSGAEELLEPGGAFRISQDQRSTASSELWFQATNRLWFGLNAWYGSGLPVELEEGEPRTADARILSRVDFDRGRLRPSYSIDVAAGADLWRQQSRAINAQLTVSNITNHVNVINFAGLLSGTAIAPSRSFNVRLRYSF